jgi:diguanylate cyclase (GGDEF)-like protein
MELAQTLATEQHSALAVLSLDIANFSRLNDSFGRDQGDQVLRAVAERIGQCLRRGERASYPARESRVSKDLLARTGGDEFYALLNGLRAPEDAAVVARRILDAIAIPLMIGTQEVVLSATVGISVFPMDGTSSEDLIEHADAARRHAKAAGRGGFHFYTSGINHLAANRVSMENALRRALQLGQFELYYQPKLRLADRQMRGVEALIRWHHPVLGLVSPGEFIPLAEETGLIVPLGRWIVHQACADLAAWQKQGLAGLSCAINVSPIQFETDGLLELLRETVTAHGLAPETLEIELTESALIHDTTRSISLLNEFRRQGFAVWVDDFGTGYSSLSYLRQFPVTGLKIDQSFIRDMTLNANDAAIVAAVIALSRSLHLEVVAEGIETIEQTAMLEPLGCDYGQGFLYGRPMPAASIARVALLNLAS